MIDYLRSTTDRVQKADVVKRLGELAERFAPDTQWFIETMNQVCLHASNSGCCGSDVALRDDDFVSGKAPPGFHFVCSHNEY